MRTFHISKHMAGILAVGCGAAAILTAALLRKRKRI